MHELDLGAKEKAAMAKHRGSVMPGRGSVSVAPAPPADSGATRESQYSS